MDKYGRPNIETGIKATRALIGIQNAQGQQEDRALRKKSEARTVQDREDFKAGSGGLSRDEVLGMTTKEGLAVTEDAAKQRDADNILGKMSDKNVLKFQPLTKWDRAALSKRTRAIGENRANRAEIDQRTKQQANKAYDLYQLGANEVRELLNSNDIAGAQERLVAIGDNLNIPYSTVALSDGKVQLLKTNIETGVKEVVDTLPVADALNLMEEKLKGGQFYNAYLVSTEARKKQNFQNSKNPTKWNNGKGDTMSTVELFDLSSGARYIEVYDKNGDMINVVNDYSKLRAQGYQKDDLASEKTKAETEYKKAQTEVLRDKKAPKSIEDLTLKERRQFNQDSLRFVKSEIKEWLKNNYNATLIQIKQQEKILTKEFAKAYFNTGDKAKSVSAFDETMTSFLKKKKAQTSGLKRIPTRKEINAARNNS